MTEKEIRMIDIADPTHGVEIQIRPDKKCLWVNVDGICKLRVTRHTSGKLRIRLDDCGRVSDL